MIPWSGPIAHKVRHLGKLLEVAALDLSGTFDQVVARVEEMAEWIMALRNEARRAALR